MKRNHTYGQHFLRSPSFVKKLIARTTITTRDTVYDIGAGSGVISSMLAGVAAKVVAVEYDTKTADKLRRNMEPYENVTVVEGDIMKLPAPHSEEKVFANIPFHLSSRIVRFLTEQHVPPASIYLIVQKQFAQKLVQNNRHFTGALGMMLGPVYDARILKVLERSDFMPRPNVDTVLIALERRTEPLLDSCDMDSYRALVEKSYHDPKVFARTPRKRCGIDETLRPSELSLAQWVALFREQMPR